ncbi:hypothetical protein EYF80_063516 [Liparis tanakae]|uniref:Uncharacterized protein n=1 Tax=Liparis tanakae TaxID=230148 RepID=A0A4Z2EC57_9TELE|nr:hypothetical protein EYF80_063516 [Liparis tanakae]
MWSHTEPAGEAVPSRVRRYRSSDPAHEAPPPRGLRPLGGDSGAAGPRRGAGTRPRCTPRARSDTERFYPPRTECIMGTAP